MSFAVDLRDKQELNNGFGNALATAFEFAVTPLILGYLGHRLDMRFDTSPILLLVFAGFAVAGMFVKMHYAYDNAMQAQEKDRPWHRPEAQ